MAVTLAELVRRFGGDIRGDGAVTVAGVAALDNAGASDVAYIVDAKYQDRLASTRAGVLILPRANPPPGDRTVWLVDDPRVTFAQVAAFLHPAPAFAGGVHASAVVAEGAQIPASCYIGPHCTVEAEVRLGERVYVGPGCHIGHGTRIGADSRLIARVTVLHDCVIGARAILAPGVVVGSDGFGYAQLKRRWLKIPQIGRVLIGDDVEIGANTTVDRGALGDTVIGNGVKLDNQIQVAHNVQIGDDTAIAGCVGIAGSAVIGRRCTIGGGTGIVGHIAIADDVHVQGMSMVTHDVTEAAVYSSAMPALPLSEWRRTVARLRRLDEWSRRLKAMEQQINQFLQRKNH